MRIEEAEFVVLFGGVENDGGGVAVDQHGVPHPIGPYGPFVAELSVAVGQLLCAGQALPQGEAREEVARMAQESVAVLGRELGLGSNTKTLMYIGDGGPWCGTGYDGKLRPRPLPTVSKNPLA